MATTTKVTKYSRGHQAAAGGMIPRPPVSEQIAPPTHPGEVLRGEFLEPLGVSQTAFADRLHIPLQRLNDLVNRRRGITPDTALRLARALGTTPELWMNLQESWDLWHAAHDAGAGTIASIEPLPHGRSGALLPGGGK